MKRVYHPYWAWEEIKYNMWGGVTDRKLYLRRAIELTGDHKKYGRFMMKVIDKWPISCENALTDQYINRKAWLGHAACALAIECPEDITREAWSKLTNEQQLLANKKAEQAIQAWEYNYNKNKGLRAGMEGEMLF